MVFDLEKTVMSALTVGVRVSALFLFTPFLGSAAMPPRVKAGLVIVITAVLYPVYGPSLSQGVGAGDWLRVMSGELLVGCVLGLALNFVFDGAQMAGQILGVQMGFSLVNIIDPQTQVDSPLLSMFHQTIVLLIFLQLNVHHWLIRGVAKSFEYLPPGSVHVSALLTWTMWKAAGQLWLIGVQIAAPALLATALADVVLGFLGKASPQFPVLFVGISVKNIIGLLVVGAALKLWPTLFEQYFASAISFGERALLLAR
jgi:flagellar biosynthesis protein FliR